MWSHLRTNHPREYASSAAKKSCKSPSLQSTTFRRQHSSQPQITTAFERLTTYSRESAKWKTVTEKIGLLIAEMMLPFAIVDHPRFRDLLKELDSRYEPPDRKYISNTAIPAQYNKMKSQVLADLKEAKHISLTSDAWSSATMDPFLSLTAHYVTPSWTLQSYCLRTIYMPESHTGANIAAMIRNILKEYNVLPQAVVSITTDSGSNMVKACDDLNFTRIPCFGHILHNSITNSTKHDKLVEAVKCVRNVVTTFSHSGKLKMDLMKRQKENGLPQKGLVGEVATRWGSKYKMMERLYENREPVQAILLSDRKFAKHNPTWDNLQLIETFLATLKPFHSLTDALSGSKKVTIPSIWPIIKLIERTCEKDITADISEECKVISREIRNKLWHYVDSRYKDADRCGRLKDLLQLSRYLDPRLVDKEEVEEITNLLVVQAVAAELGSDEGAETSILSGEVSSSSEVNISRVNTDGELNIDSDGEESDLMSLLMSTSSSMTVVEEDADTRARKEIGYYLQSAPSTITKQCDLLQWWAEKGSRFPMLSRVARKYLSANATSTASERNFSFAGMISSKRRRSLKPEKIDMLTCLAYNLRVHS